MATCCSVLAWRISGYSPWSPRVSRDGVTNRVHFRSKQPMRGNGGCKVQPLGKKVRWKEGGWSGNNSDAGSRKPRPRPAADLSG